MGNKDPRSSASKESYLQALYQLALAKAGMMMPKEIRNCYINYQEVLYCNSYEASHSTTVKNLKLRPEMLITQVSQGCGVPNPPKLTRSAVVTVADH